MFFQQIKLAGSLPRINRKYVPTYNRKSRKSYMRLSKEWNQKFGAMILQMNSAPIKMIDYEIDLVIFIRVHNRTDSDAIIKGVFDALEEAGVIRDDNLISDFMVMRDKYDGTEAAEIYFSRHGEMLTDFFEKVEEVTA